MSLFYGKRVKMTVSVKVRNEVYIDRKHAVIMNKINTKKAVRVEIKAFYLKEKCAHRQGNYSITDFKDGHNLIVISGDTSRTFRIRAAKFNTTRQKLVVLLAND